MRAIDGLLNIVKRQEATELRLAANRPPRLFRGGDELPLTMPPTSATALGALLGDLVAAHEPALRAKGTASFDYESADAGSFHVTLSGAPDGDLEARFARRSAAPAGPPVSSPERGSAAREPPAPPSAVPAALALVLDRALAAGASDVHLAEGEVPTIRVDGQLRPLAGVGAPDIAGLLTEPGHLERVRAGRSVDLGLDVAGIGRLRVNVYVAASGLSAAIRLLAREAPRLEDLHLPAVVGSLVDLPHGLVIACGPTGSGKSTTLAALAQQAMRARPHLLITLEDPIEYRIQPHANGLVRQRQIGRHVADFATGLRDALREDPDVLLIGEMRDAESIGLALTAAETGHLVFTSLHSRTSGSAVERIVDTYPPERQRQIRVQLADALRAVIAQRLVPRADGRGRIAVVEFLRVTPGVANLIRESKTPQIVSALQSGGEDGMVPLERSLAELVRGGVIRADAARAVASEPKTLDEYLRARA
jgi:twitching motility protein PilT